MTKTFAVVFMFLVAVLTGCSGGSGPAAVTTAPVFAISGKVTVNGNGLGGVAILLSSPSGTNISTVNTQSDGTFNLASVTNGSYTLSATLAGYAMSANQTVIVNGADVSSVNFTVTGMWQQLGSVPAARISALAVDPANNQNIYAGGDGKMFKSVDGGTSWSSINSGLPTNPGKPISAVGIDSANSQNVYLTMGDGGGVFKSTDGGASWTAINSGITNPGVWSLAVDPSNTQNTAVNAVAVDPTNSQNIYLGALGVSKSIDGGASWTVINTGIPNDPHATPSYPLSISSLAIDPTNNQIIYAGTFEGGVFKSTNGGALWTAMNNGKINLYVTSLAMDPTDNQNIYAATFEGMSKSTNGGASWTNSGFPNQSGYSQPVTTLVMDPTDSHNVYVGSYNGAVYRLVNF